MKKLMTNGCSMTKGVYNNFNEHDAWPWQLASLIDMEQDQLVCILRKTADKQLQVETY